MPGFYITNCDPTIPVNHANARCVQDQMELDGYTIYRNTRDQFLDDKLFFYNNKLAVVLEGVILNKAELLERYRTDTLENAVVSMINENPRGFYNDFRGMFSGAVFFANTKQWIVFADHIANRAVFYYVDEVGRFIAGSQLNYITDTMRANNLDRTLDENGVRQFLSYGCFMDDSTCLTKVKRILPGDYILFHAGKVSTHTYYRLPEQEDASITDKEAIELLDEKFRIAVARGLDKNREYGYTGVLDISGGADSRINAYVARSLCSNSELMLLHYSQSGSYEEEIAKGIASELEFEYYYNALDDALFLTTVDEIVSMNSGTGYYCGITGGARALEQLSGKPLGIEFTGLLGDIYEGAMITSNGNIPPAIEYGRYRISNVFKNDDIAINTLERFRTNNAFWLYTRGMLCGMNTFLTRQNYVEPYTPHGDVDFIEACMFIPWDRKVNDRLQLRWLATRYPEAMKHRYAVTGMKLSSEFHLTAPLMRKFNAARNLLSLRLKGTSRYSMNPFSYWERKPWLNEFIEEYYSSSMNTLQEAKLFDSKLRQKVEDTYRLGGVAKYTVITFLSYCKQFIL